MLKCSRCRHIFPAPQTQRPQPIAPASTADPDDKRETGDLTLSFDEAEWDAPQPELALEDIDEAYSLDSTRPGPPGPKTPSAGPSRQRSGSADPLPTVDAGEPDETGSIETAKQTPRTVATSSKSIDVADLADEEDDDDIEDDIEDDEDRFDDVPAGSSMTSRRASLVPVFVLFSIVVVFYFFVARSLIGNHRLADGLVSRLPLVGSSLAADRLLFRKVALVGVESSFVRTREGRHVLLVSGNAVNTASRPLRNIEIEATLLDGDQHELRREVTTCGGVISKRMLRDLSLRELESLRRVEPKKQFSLAPGESAPFAVLFPDPPAATVEYLGRVTAAQGQT